MGEPVAMPIGSKVSWNNTKFVMGSHYEYAADRNHRQSLRRLAERGGLVWSEAAAIVELRPFFRMNEDEAERVVRQHLTAQVPA